MTIDVNIINGNLFTSDGFRYGGISIDGNKIVKIGKEPSLPKASLKINAKGALIIPGLIDIHVHFRDLEQKYKETMETGSRSAISGGVTTVLDMPNNKPPTNTAIRLQNKRKIIQGKAAANIGFHSLVPEKVDEIIPIAKEGIFGYKIYPASLIYPPKNNEKLQLFLRQIAEVELPLVIHPDNGYAAENEKRLIENDRPYIEAFLKAHNQVDEGKALNDFIDLNKQTNAHLHCAHVTAKETIEVLQKNKNQNNLSSEVCAHHLLLTTDDLKKLKAQAKCLPPVRTGDDQAYLWKALNEEIIKIVATDHAPHSYNEKHCEFESAAAGIHGLETLLPLMFTAAAKGKITFEKLIPTLTTNPAKLMKIEKRGELKEGYFADIVIVAKEKGKINAVNFESKAKWTPFDGNEILYTPKYVFVNGFMSKEEDYVVTKARAGKILQKKNKIPKETLADED